MIVIRILAAIFLLVCSQGSYSSDHNEAVTFKLEWKLNGEYSKPRYSISYGVVNSGWSQSASHLTIPIQRSYSCVPTSDDDGKNGGGCSWQSNLSVFLIYTLGFHYVARPLYNEMLGTNL